MSSTHKGFICDVCGDPIVIFPREKLKPFVVKGMNMLFHMHSRCKPILMRANKERNWMLLCDGPLKEAYYVACKRRGIEND